MTVEIFPFTPTFCSLHCLNRRVDDTALIGIHGLQGTIASCLDRLCRNLLSENLQGVLAFFSIIANIQRNTEIGIFNMVGYQAGQILKCVQCFSTMADDKTDILTGQGNQGPALFLFDVKLHIGQTHIGKNALQIFCRSICGTVLDICAHLRRISSKQAKCLFYRHLQDFKFRLVGFYPQFLTRGLKGLFHRITRSNCFFDHV